MISHHRGDAAAYPLNEALPWWELSDLGRREARAEFTRVMDTRYERIASLQKLLRSAGVEFDGTDDGVQALTEWFQRVVDRLPNTRNNPDEMSLSISHDVALLLGELLIARHPKLRWEFYTWGKKNIYYQAYVIMGFTAEEDAWHGAFSPLQAVYGYAVEILNHRTNEPVFIDVPPDHILHGVGHPEFPFDDAELVHLLDKIDKRCRER